MFLQHLSVTLLVLATLLLLLVSLSVPISHKIYFLKANMSVQLFATKTATSKMLYFGNWGWCRATECTPAALGYNIETLSSIPGVSKIETVVRKFTGGLLLNAIACCATFVAALLGMSGHSVISMLATFASAFAFLTTFLALTFDLALFVTVRSRLNHASSNIHAKLGPALWLVVASIVMQFVATVAMYWMQKLSVALRIKQKIMKIKDEIKDIDQKEKAEGAV